MVYHAHLIDNGSCSLLCYLAYTTISHWAIVLTLRIFINVNEPVGAATNQDVKIGIINQWIVLDSFWGPSILLNLVKLIRVILRIECRLIWAISVRVMLVECRLSIWALFHCMAVRWDLFISALGMSWFEVPAFNGRIETARENLFRWRHGRFGVICGILFGIIIELIIIVNFVCVVSKRHNAKGCDGISMCLLFITT